MRVTILKTEIAGAKDLKTAEERIKCQITKYQMCMGCLACESVCRFNALSIRENKDGEIEYHISDEKCKRCGECEPFYGWMLYEKGSGNQKTADGG